MAVYSVLEPPLRPGKPEKGPEGFVFVRDGFNWGAFLFASLWMLWRRLWLAFLGYVLLIGALELTFRLIGAPAALRGGAALLIALLIGLEAGSLRRWSMARRGWRDHGVVIADDLEGAERRFFAEWAGANGAAEGSHASADANAVSLSPPQRARSRWFGLFRRAGADR